MFRIAALILVLLSSSPAVALDCDVRSSHLDKFGLTPLGASWKAVAASARRLDNCVIDRAKNYADCAFLDSSGVRYIAFGPSVVTKEVSARALARVTLPVRLNANSSLLETIKELTRFPNSPSFYVAFRNEKVVVTSDHCLRNSEGTVFSFYVVFSANGILELVGTRILTEVD